MLRGPGRLAVRSRTQNARGRDPQQRGAATHIRCSLALLLAAFAQAAQAADGWEGTLAFTTDYIYQGLSQTRDGAAFQAGLRVQPDTQWTLGVWASQVDRTPGPGADLEIDLFAARTWQVNPVWAATLALTHYEFPDDTSYLSYDYDEVSASLAYRSTIVGAIGWSPNVSDYAYDRLAQDKDMYWYELTAVQPIVGGLSCSLGVGYRDLSALFEESYWYGHAGVILSWRALDVYLTYTFVDDTAQRLFGHDRASSRWSGGVVWKFGAAD